MPGLMLSLKADEKFLVNGALVQNGPKRGQIRLTDASVNVLRLSDCIHPDEVNSPVGRAYYQAQLILSGDVERSAGQLDLTASLSSLETVFAGTAMEPQIAKASLDAVQERYYSVLVILKRLMPVEAQLLAHTHRQIAVKEAVRKLHASG